MTPTLVAAGDAGWETGLLAAFGRNDLGVQVARRCVDVADLLAAAAAGLGTVALVDASLRRLDRDALARLTAAGVGVVALVGAADPEAERRMRQLGVDRLHAAGTAPEVLAASLRAAAGGPRPGYDDGDPLRSLPALGRPQPAAAQPQGAGSVVAVWGPTGAPGRTTVALGLAAELASQGRQVLLIDADPYGGCIAQLLGLLEEAPGLAAAARAATAGTLDATSLAFLCRDVGGLRVLPGLVRPERWPELRASSVAAVVDTARRLADVVVVDTGFCLELDEELAFDTIAPRRNGATLEVLAAADTVLAVGSADPVGLARLVRAAQGLDHRPAVVLNRVRGHEREARQLVRQHLGSDVVAAVPFDLAALDRAAAQGRTVVEVAPRSEVRKALTALARALPAGRLAGSHA